MTLAEILADKKLADTQEITLGENKFTLGELRTIQSAGVDLQSRLEKEAEQRRVAEEAVLNLFKENETLKTKAPVNEPPKAADWKSDPFYAPVVAELDTITKGYQTEREKQETLLKQLTGGIKALVDRSIRDEYMRLPDEFRKEVPFEQAVRAAAEKGYKDSMGLVSPAKVFDEWDAPRREQKRISAEVEKRLEAERQKWQQSSLPRPGSLPGAPPAPDPNAPKNMKESFNRAKSDPEILDAIYGINRGNA